jgi:hypothetical protein
MKLDTAGAISRMDAELKLLIACLGPAERTGDWEPVPALIQNGIDWKAFCFLADRHRVTAPVYNRLSELGSETLPKTVLITLQHHGRKIAQEVLLKAAELALLSKQFEKKGIAVLALKGPALALQIYGVLGTRSFRDLDIMVAPERLEKAEKILLSNGYQRIDPAFVLSPRQYLSYLQTGHHFNYFSKEKNQFVELHWRFSNSRHLFPFEFHDLWKAHRTVEISGAEIHTPSNEHTAFLLFVHGALHAWSRLFWLYDIHHLLRQDTFVDWPAFMKNAGRIGINRMVAEGILLAHLFFGSPIPESMHEIARDKAIQRLIKISLFLMKEPEAGFIRPFSLRYVYEKVYTYSLCREPGYKLAFFFQHLRPASVDWFNIPLPDTLFPFYYVIRPFLWFFRVMRS